jgi:hypothetical protein
VLLRIGREHKTLSHRQKAEGGPVISKYNPVKSAKRLKSDLRYQTSPVFTPEKGAVRHPGQYRATMMIATTRNAAISESA